MRIYLLRHAIAVRRGAANYTNDDRPLTEQGRIKLERETNAIVSLLGDIDVILTSPLSRARDTANIIALALSAAEKVETCEYLAPGSAVKNLLLSLGKYKNFNSIMLVGHEPDLGFIASALLGSSASVVRFKKGALCCIEIAGLPVNKPGRILWLLPPKVLRKIARDS